MYRTARWRDTHPTEKHVSFRSFAKKKKNYSKNGIDFAEGILFFIRFTAFFKKIFGVFMVSPLSDWERFALLGLKQANDKIKRGAWEVEVTSNTLSQETVLQYESSRKHGGLFSIVVEYSNRANTDYKPECEMRAYANGYNNYYNLASALLLSVLGIIN